MKKLFFSLMLIAALAFSFASCKKTTSESETHSQTFTLGETTYDINNAITIKNIQYNGSQNYNAIVLSHGQIVGNGGNGQGIVIVFRGAINAGTYTLSFDPVNPNATFPQYFFADLEVTDIVNFNIDEFMQQDGVYVAESGSFTLEVNDDIYTITTDGIEVEKVKDAAILETSSVDYEGGMLNYVLATVEEGDINGTNIVTAGATKYDIPFGFTTITTNIAAFIDENGNMIGFTSSTTSFANGLPEGTFTNSEYPIIMLEGMNVSAIKFASSGDIVISKEGESYTIDITNMKFTGLTGTYTLHYVGTFPFFDFPF